MENSMDKVPTLHKSEDLKSCNNKSCKNTNLGIQESGKMISLMEKELRNTQMEANTVEISSKELNTEKTVL